MRNVTFGVKGNPKRLITRALSTPVSREQFTTKATSTSEDDLLRAELDYISKAKEAAEDDTTEIPSAEHISRIRGALDDPNEADPDDNYLFGLALSGGGIRSATFSLGVLQRLARAGLLKEVDYLSTVLRRRLHRRSSELLVEQPQRLTWPFRSECGRFSLRCR